MKKGLNEKQEIEFLYIKEWCITIIDFILKNKRAKHIEIYKEPFSEETRNKYLSELGASTYVRLIKQARNNIEEWAIDFIEDDFSELNKILIEKFGEGLNDNRNKKLITQVLKRGKIKDEYEYTLLDNAVGELSLTEPESKEIEIYNKLLIAFHNNNTGRK